MRVSLAHIFVIKSVAVVLALGGAPAPLALAGFFIPDLWILHHLFMPGASGLVRTFTRFAPDGNEVWLTIDDGPDPHDTPRLLDLLDQHRARATFFLIGEHAARHPALVAEIARRGHELAHHTHTHPTATFWCAGPRRVRRELDAALPALTPRGGAPPSRFRAPAGIKNLFLGPILRTRRLACIGWSVRSRDSFARAPEPVAARVLRAVRPGNIILMHEGPALHRDVRVAAVAAVLAGLTARGFTCAIPADHRLR